MADWRKVWEGLKAQDWTAAPKPDPDFDHFDLPDGWIFYPYSTFVYAPDRSGTIFLRPWLVLHCWTNVPTTIIDGKPMTMEEWILWKGIQNMKADEITKAADSASEKIPD